MSTKFLKGKYIIGDLCYILNDNAWDKVCNFLENNDGGEFKLGEYNCWIHSTAYGDGLYCIEMCDEERVQNTNKNWMSGTPVDSGTIGIIPLEIAFDIGFVDESLTYDRDDLIIVSFDESFYVDYYDGTFAFDDIKIITDEESFY